MTHSTSSTPSTSLPAGASANGVEAEFQDFSYRVSHDLGAPVRAMVEFSKLLASEHAAAIGAEGMEYLSIIVSSGQQMQAMMEGLLEYSRLTTRSRPFQQADLDTIARDSLVILEKKIADTNADISIGVMPVVSCDAIQIGRMFDILIMNALIYQPSGQTPKITISSDRAESGWRLAISDNGIGIDPRFYDKIFQMFQRLHTSEAYPGNGVGLALARKIARRHGGDIWCDSAPGKGSTFYVTLGSENVAALSDVGDRQ